MRVRWLGYIVMITLIGCVQSNPSTPIGKLTGIKGGVFRQSSNGQEQLAVGTAIYGADAIGTSPDGKAEIALDDGSKLDLGNNSKLKFVAYHQNSSDGAVTRIQVDVGVYGLGVPSTANMKMEVEARKVLVTAANAAFMVDVGADKTAVAALHGTVAVQQSEIPGSEVVLNYDHAGTDVLRAQVPTAPKPWGNARFASTIDRASFDFTIDRASFDFHPR